MEYIDVLDENGKATGEIKTRQQIHKEGGWHKAVHAWIINDKNEILLQKRSETKDLYPDCWDISTAGHVSAGEDSIGALIREAKEELDLDLERDNFHHVTTYKNQLINETRNDWHINEMYIVEMTDGQNFKFSDKEVSEVIFVTSEQFKKMLEDEPSKFFPHKIEYPALFDYLKKVKSK